MKQKISRRVELETKACEKKDCKEAEVTKEVVQPQAQTPAAPAQMSFPIPMPMETEEHTIAYAQISLGQANYFVELADVEDGIAIKEFDGFFVGKYLIQFQSDVTGKLCYLRCEKEIFLNKANVEAVRSVYFKSTDIIIQTNPKAPKKRKSTKS